MRTPLIAGNWKMNGSRASIQALLLGILQEAAALNQVEWLVFPPAVYIEQVANQLTNTNSTLHYGLQNISAYDSGAHTGELAASMAADMGCQYVLVGHSERRSLYGESNELVAAKFLAAQHAGLKPVLCVGESLTQREAGLAQQVVTEQLDAVIEQAGVSALTSAVVAYEPVWAIGTGKTASAEEAQGIHQQIRDHIENRDSAVARELRILYGGSLKPANAAGIFSMPDIDGGLIGGASLVADDFIQIARSWNN